jgi:hypothetical protein
MTNFALDARETLERSLMCGNVLSYIYSTDLGHSRLRRTLINTVRQIHSCAMDDSCS